MQKQATALNELHEQNGVAWETVDNVLYFALNSQWWEGVQEHLRPEAVLQRDIRRHGEGTGRGEGVRNTWR